MEKSLKSIASRYGLYLGVILTVIALIVYFENLDLFLQPWFGFSIYVLCIISGIVSIIHGKQAFGGYLSFRNTFTAYFIANLIGISVFTLVTFILFNYANEEASAYLQEQSIAKNIEVLKSIGTSAEKLAATKTNLESENLFSLGNAIQTLIITYIIPLSLIGLLVAAVMKKNKPNS